MLRNAFGFSTYDTFYFMSCMKYDSAKSKAENMHLCLVSYGCFVVCDFRVCFVCLFPFSGYFSFQSPAFHILSVILTLTISCRFTHTGSLIAALPSYP